jgi:cyclophilin family peptidyl-prolyl cis-trans isomerase
VVDVRAAAYEATADCLEGRARELLLPGLEDRSPIVVATCLRRLGESNGDETVSLLLDAASDRGDRRRRLGAVQGLAAAGDRIDLAALTALLEDRDLFVATTAAEALGERGDAAATSALMAALQKPGPRAADLRLASSTALGKLGDPRAVEILRSVLATDDDPRIRLAARHALEEILPPEESIGLPDADEIRRDVRPVTRSTRQAGLVTRSNAEQLVLHTDRGRITIDLFGEDAPQMVESFAALADSGFFEKLTFHRVVGDFVIQGGDPTGTGWGDAGYTLRSEWNPRRYQRGTVGIAHSGKDTGSCQLFITQSPQPHLDARYTIWGEVVSGMEVVDRIRRGDTFRAEVRRRAE